jgi:Flp pilus assembly protein TadG
MARFTGRVNEEGSALVFAALIFSTVLAFVALAVDVGTLFQAKRKLQTASDSAAIAATQDYLFNQSVSSATTAGDTASSNNGYTNGSSGAVVTVSSPPADGPNAGKSGFFEARVSQPQRTFFMGLVGFSSMTVKARSVAGTPDIGDVCIWVMAPTGPSMQLQGSYNIQAPGCGIYVNSPSSDAFADTGNGGIVNAKFLDVVGNSPPAHETTPTSVTVNAQARTSPWGNLSGPTPTNGGCTSVDTTTTSLTGTVSGPGAGNAICYAKAVTITNATLGAGTYMFENGVTVSGTVTLNGGTIDIYGGTFNQGNAILNVTAPTSGTYDGIAILQPSSNTNQLQVQFGSSNETLDGYIYAPGAQVYLQDNGGGTVYTGIVAGTLYDKSSTVRIPSYDLQHSSTTVNRVVTLVE